MRYSPSQISTFVSCERQWGWRYLVGIRGEQDSSQALGTAVHKQLENYLKGEPFDFSKPGADIAASGVEYLPPGIVDTCEDEFEFTYKGVTFFGYKDIELRGHVYDHKTTSNIKKWKKTEEQLRKDVQANIYAWDGFLKWPELDRVRLTWIYYQTKGAQVAEPTSFEVEREEVEKFMEPVVQVARILEEHRRRVDVANPSAYVLNVLKPEPSACDKFRGCPHRGLCNLSPQERMSGVMSESTEDILARLKKATTFNPPEAAEPEPAKKVEVIAAASEEAPAVKVVVKSDANTDAAPAIQAAIEKTKQKKCVLYVGCKPTGSHESFENLLQKVQEEILKTQGKSDWRYIQFTGAGVLLETFKQTFEASVPTKLVVAYPESPEARIILPWLSTRCTEQVVRA